jgi:PIN domain nuclease of toxin-antitoxin system
MWALNRPEKLNRQVQRQIDSPKNQLYLSPISIWEADLLARRRRLKVKGTFSEWLERSFSQIPIQEAPIDFLVAMEVTRIELPQPDIGDLFLAATACAQGLTLVTADAQLLQCSWLKTLANQ